MVKRICKTCHSNDCFLCDKKGIWVKDEDTCDKWNKEKLTWKEKLMQRFLMVN